MKPKFVLYEKKSFFAQGHRRVCTNKILKEKTEPVLSSCKETVTKVITIHRELPPSILNCAIIKLEYRLKVNFTILWSKDSLWEVILHFLFLRHSSVHMFDYCFVRVVKNLILILSKSFLRTGLALLFGYDIENTKGKRRILYVNNCHHNTVR